MNASKFSREARPPIAGIVRWAWYSITVSALLVALHGAIAAASGSLAITAELIHNFVDLVSGGAVLTGLTIATRKSRVFPYGLYKLENVAAAAIAVMVFFTAYELLRLALFGTSVPLRVDTWMLGLLVGALAIPLAFGHLELRIARAANSPALIAQAREYRVHAYTTGVAFAALLSARFKLPVDRIAALVIVAAVIKTGFDLLTDAARVLLDASLDADSLNEVRQIIGADHAVAEVNWITGRNAGRFRFVEAGVALRVSDLALAEAAIQRIEGNVRNAVPQVERLLLQIESRTSAELRYAIPLADLSGKISEHFGEAPYFAFVTVDRTNEAIKERRLLANPHRLLERAKGIRVAEWLASEKVDVVLVRTDLTGKGPSYVLRDAGIKAKRTDKPTLADAFASRSQ